MSDLDRILMRAAPAEPASLNVYNGLLNIGNGFQGGDNALKFGVTVVIILGYG